MTKRFRGQFFQTAITFSVVLCLFSTLSAQFSRAKLESIKNQLRLLELKRADVAVLLSPGSLSSLDRSDDMQTFYRYDETIDVFYSTGRCPKDNFEFMPWDAWNVPNGTLVGFEVAPKDELIPADLGLDLRKLRKEQPYRTHKNYLVYFDKDSGIAVYVQGDSVKTIRYFPPRSIDSKLCDSPGIKKYFRGDKWRFMREPRHEAVDFNRPANVEDINLVLAEAGKVLVIVTARDPENDVLTYNYKVSAGRIIGVGANVTWDLSGQAPGTYSISCAVDDGVGFRGRYVTKTFKLDISPSPRSRKNIAGSGMTHHRNAAGPRGDGFDLIRDSVILQRGFLP